MWKIQTDLLSAKILFKSTEKKINPVRVLNLFAHEIVICKNSDVSQYYPVETAINSEQLPEFNQKSAKGQQEFGVSVERIKVEQP